MPNNLTVLPNKASTSATTVLRDKLTSLRIPLIPSTPPKMASFALAFPSKKEDESGLSSYYNNKTTIIQEARVFNESPVSPRKCRQLLTRIVYLLYAGETFSTQEATTLFFGTTKLFQHKDVRLCLVALTSGRLWSLINLPFWLGSCRARCVRRCIWLSRNLQLRLKM